MATGTVRVQKRMIFFTVPKFRVFSSRTSPFALMRALFGYSLGVES